MPKLRRLGGSDIVRILQKLGFEIIRVRGSHHILRRTISGEIQTVNVPVHGNKPLPIGTLKRLYRDLLRYLPQDELDSHFIAV